MKKSSIYLARLRDRILFYSTLLVVALLVPFLIFVMKSTTAWDYKATISMAALCLSFCSLLTSVSKFGVEHDITLYHRLLKSETEGNKLIIYNLSSQDLLIFSMHLNIESKGSWYLQNSIEHPIKLDTLDNVKIALKNNDIHNEGSDVKDEQLTLLTSLGKVRSKKLDGVLMSSSSIKATIIKEKDLL